MSYFRKTPKLLSQLETLSHNQTWLVMINADPDAMASAGTLSRIMSKRVARVDIARINEISRPDNLAMLRYTRIRIPLYTQAMLYNYTHFAMVDSQPSHSPEFANMNFSMVIDHHPVVTEAAKDMFLEVLPDYGATSTIMTEYLYNLGIRPGRLLATALQFGIKTDTMNFQRHASDVDLRAYQYLAKFSDPALLSRIIRSEFHLDWLQYFARATTNMHKAGTGFYIYIGKVESPDILVVLADFFTRVYEIRWVAVGGFYGTKAVLIFRSDGSQDMGRLAKLNFNDLGSGGGHKTMARAEFEMVQAGSSDLELFIYKRLLAPMPRTKSLPHSADNEHIDADQHHEPVKH
jgi:nanoRNase/pAp phosphatase (c-di-AMP/oligoRNAs hydrolase)